MNARIAGLVVALVAPLAVAQDYHQAVPVTAPPIPAVQVQFGVGVRPMPPPPARHGGRWEMRTTQQWVPGAVQQVWVPGQCYGSPHRPWAQRCSQGQYVTQQLPGRYETVQQWVWVDSGWRDDRYGGGRRYGRR